METAFYPVVTVENEEELEVIVSYCDENKIEYQYLDDNVDDFPAQILLFIDKDDFKMDLFSEDE